MYARELATAFKSKQLVLKKMAHMDGYEIRHHLKKNKRYWRLYGRCVPDACAATHRFISFR